MKRKAEGNKSIKPSNEPSIQAKSKYIFIRNIEKKDKKHFFPLTDWLSSIFCITSMLFM